MRKDYDTPEAERGLETIIARIQGEWDNPYLLRYGPLSTDEIYDILIIAKAALKIEREKYEDNT